MTKKKRKLIEIILDNVKPDDWPENLLYAAQGKSNGDVWAYSSLPKINGLIYGQYFSDGDDAGCILGKAIMCQNWNTTIVHRDEFIKRWNERSVAVEAKTPQQLALEKFGTDWQGNEGVQPELDEVVIDIILS